MPEKQRIDGQRITLTSVKKQFLSQQYEPGENLELEYLETPQLLAKASTNIVDEHDGRAGGVNSSLLLPFSQTRETGAHEVAHVPIGIARSRESETAPPQQFLHNWRQDLPEAERFDSFFSEREPTMHKGQNPQWSTVGTPKRTEQLSPSDPVRSRARRSAIDVSLPGIYVDWMSEWHQRVFMSLLFFAIGFSAITALAIAIIGILPLDIAAYTIVWPAIVFWTFIGILYPRYGKLALTGFLIGLIACFFYDSMRFVFIQLGIWGDFIPNIGMWLLHTNKPDVLIGYLWRYIGDGGFMGMAFTVVYRALKPRLDVRLAALAFGLAIWLCLIVTVLIAPHGAQMLFALTPITFTLSLLGHIIYGMTIGLLYPVFIGPRSEQPI